MIWSLLNERKEQRNLREADLRGLYLQKAYLSNADLSGANLSNSDLSGANLSNANLSSAYMIKTVLEDANLRQANLNNANLKQAKLNGTILDRANLENASLYMAEMVNAILDKANLKNAYLYLTDMSGASMEEANLSGADLTFVDLIEASIINTTLSNAKFTDINLKETRYEPNTTPDISSLGGIKNLETVLFLKEKQSGLVLLRHALKEVGLNKLEREATFVIEKGKTKYSDSTIYKVLRTIFFDYTSRYGLSPDRCIFILFIFMPFFALIYFAALYFPLYKKLLLYFEPAILLLTIELRPKYNIKIIEKDGIYRMWPNDRIRKDLGTPNPES